MAADPVGGVGGRLPLWRFSVMKGFFIGMGAVALVAAVAWGRFTPGPTRSRVAPAVHADTSKDVDVERLSGVVAQMEGEITRLREERRTADPAAPAAAAPARAAPAARPLDE